jgi:hypothetical protein
MKAFLNNLKIEKIRAKGKCQLDDNKSDPIGFGLYQQLYKWDISTSRWNWKIPWFEPNKSLEFCGCTRGFLD